MDDRSTIPALASRASIRPHFLYTPRNALACESYDDTSAWKYAALGPRPLAGGMLARA